MRKRVSTGNPVQPCRMLQALVLALGACMAIQIPCFLLHSCKAVAADKQRSLHARVEPTPARTVAPLSSVHRSLLGGLTFSNGLSVTWPLSSWTSTGSSSSSNGGGGRSSQDHTSGWYQPGGGSSASSTPCSLATEQEPASRGSASSPSPTRTSPPGQGLPVMGARNNGSTNNPCWVPDGNRGGTELLTVESRCSKDEFNIAVIEYNTTWTWSGSETIHGVYFSGGWAVVKGLTDHQQIRPRQQGGDSGQYVAVMRVKDRQWVVPKGVRTDSSSADSSSSSSSNSERLIDISGSKQRACVLVGVSPDRPFPRFRIVVKADGDRVLADSVAAVGQPIFKGVDGVACEALRHEAVLGYYYYERDYTQGRLADVYDPSGCKFVIDACSS